MKNILQYLRRTIDVFLIFEGGLELKLKGYTDSSFQSEPNNSKLILGYVFILNDGAMSWKSSKQSIIADSTTKVEYIAANEASKEAI